MNDGDLMGYQWRFNGNMNGDLRDVYIYIYVYIHIHRYTFMYTYYDHICIYIYTYKMYVSRYTVQVPQVLALDKAAIHSEAVFHTHVSEVGSGTMTASMKGDLLGQQSTAVMGT